MSEINGWIYRENFEHFVDLVAELSEYGLHEAERSYIESGLSASDSDASPPRWLEYEFEGDKNTRFRVGLESGTDVVLVALYVPDSLHESAKTTIDILNRFRLSRF